MHISYLQAVILGIVEGLTEFLPVSSTGHLTIAEKIMGLKVDDAGVTAYTAVIQMGAIVAAIVYFLKDIVAMVTGFFRGLTDADARRHHDFRMAINVILGTIPIAIVGVAAKPIIEGDLRSLWWVGAALVAWSAVMVYAERRARQNRGEGSVGVKDALLIGLAQCVALIPGVSRSGATISAGLLRGLDRVTATRLSFFLGIPALLAAGLLEMKDIPGSGIGVGETIVGTVVSFVVAYAAVAWLLRFVAGHTIVAFVPYRVFVGLVVLGCLAAGVMSAT